MAKNDLHNALQNVIEDNKPRVRKSLVIGLGGSGMKGVLSAKNWIEDNIPLEAHRYMRWIGIDTTDIETSIEGKGGRYRFPSDQNFEEEKRMLYVAAPTPSELSDEYLRAKATGDPAYTWLPNPDVYDISTRAGQGANQTRALGRLGFFHNENAIREALTREKERLEELSDHPKYFQLLDVKEGKKKHDDWIEFKIERGKNRYYFYDHIPPENTILSIEPDKQAQALLAPQAQSFLTLEDFSVDVEKGPYFEVPGKHLHGRSLRFRVRHLLQRGQISIFITCSIVGGTGNGMILDMAALVRDIFRDTWPAPRIYGILVLPSAFKRVVYNRNARANAYAALKEIDYFMSGNPFQARYPSGRTLEIRERLFNDGMLYLLDVENMSGNALQGRDQVQTLTGQFIATFVASTVGGAIEERMVNDSTRASVFLPADETSPRRASFNSFGISRVIYPVIQLRDLGFQLTAEKMVGAFLEPVNGRLLIETMGDLNRGLVRALRLHCKLIFERMYPDYKMDSEVEFRSYRIRLKKALQKRDSRKVISLLGNIRRDYDKAETEKIKANLLARIQKRAQAELNKASLVLRDITHKFLKDPNRGFPFAEAALNLLLGKLEIYQKKYYQERIGLARYPDEAFDKLLDEAETKGQADPQLAEAFVEMADFNFRQLVAEAMLQGAEDFTREYKSLLYNLKNTEVHVLGDKLETLREQLKANTEELRFNLLEKKNPLYFYLINEKEIEEFLEKYFDNRLSLEDLCSEADFVKMDREDDTFQFLETWLLSREGLAVLEKSHEEVRELIQDQLGADILEKPVEEVRLRLYGDHGESTGQEGLVLSDASMLSIEIENIRKKLFKIIYSRFSGVNFENISLKQLLDEKNIKVRRLLEKLDHFSRPYIHIEPTGLRSMEYYRVVTNFRLDTYEEGDDPETSPPNDLPSRLNHYKKRSRALPNISVETFEVPNLCKPYEMISLGILLGFPIFKIGSLEAAARDYHALVSEKSHPLHLFNHHRFDARYFPDPFRRYNYLNPAHLWNGLVALKVLLPTKSGKYVFEKGLRDRLKDMEAREDYKKKVLDLEEKVLAGGGWEDISADVLTECCRSLALLARNPVSKKMQFRREYSLVIRDILDGTDTESRAREAKLTREKYLESKIENPEFTDLSELALFLENETRIRDYLRDTVQKIVDATRGNTEAGAVIQIPAWKKEKTKLPVFADKYAFFNYFEERGSLEWQNLLKERLVKRLNKVVSSSRFRLESDPTLPDRGKIENFLKKLDQKVPEIVLWETRVMNKIIS